MIGCLTELSSVVLFLKLKLNGKLTMSTANPNENLLLEALRGFVDEYDNDRGSWPDDMVTLLDRAHHAISAATGLPRADYTR
jgi:hypothetical protein